MFLNSSSYLSLIFWIVVSCFSRSSFFVKVVLYVEEFPINIECKLIKTIELGSHIQFIGEIVEVKISEEVVDEKGNSDIAKLKPISFVGNDRGYYGLGDKLGNAFSIGKDFKK